MFLGRFKPVPPARHGRRGGRSGASCWGVLGGGLGLLVGCTQPQTVESPVPVPERFLAEGGQAAVAAEWWQAFDDDGLNARIARALAANLDLRAVAETLREAEAVFRAAGARRYPTLDATLDGEYRRDEAGTREDYELGLAAAFEVDLWGRVRAAAEAERFRFEASVLDYQTAALTLAAEVAVNHFQLVEARAQFALLRAQLDANEKVLSSLETRFGGGLVRSADLLRQRQLIENTREQIHRAEARIAVLQHALAVLEGLPPEARELSLESVLPALPPAPATGVPAALIERRPEVRAALARVRAANADLAVAVAERFPRLTLSASLSTAAEAPSALFDDWIRTLAGELVAPLIDAGGRAAEVRRREAIERQRLLAYGQAVLEAFREVEDALVREQQQRAILASQGRQVDLARDAYERLRVEYFNGAADYLDVLNALLETQRLERDRLEARRVLLEFRISLYRALAGAPLQRPPESETSP